MIKGLGAKPTPHPSAPRLPPKNIFALTPLLTDYRPIRQHLSDASTSHTVPKLMNQEVREGQTKAYGW